MSISSELLTLQNTKTAIRTAINNKGGSVGASDTFASYATAIDNLPSGGGNADLIDLIERDITSINIPSGTTTIGYSVFSGCTSLTSVSIPDSVTSISDYAFSGCTSLTSVNITDLAAWCNTQIGNSNSSPLEFAHHLYLNGSEITNLTIPNSVTNVKQYTFSKCTGLTSVVIPNHVTTISARAFNECTGLTSVTIGNSLTTISNYGFYGCTSLTKVILPSTMTSLGMYAFNGCSNLTCVVFQGTTPPSVNNSLYGTYPIYVPAESVEAYKAASGWSSYASRIQAIPVPTAMKWTSSDETQEISIACEDLATAGTLVQADRTAADTGNLIGTVVGSAEIGDCVTTIGPQAFYNCSSLASVTLPDSVTSIGAGAFYNCSSLASVTINATTPPFLDEIPFDNTNDCPIYVPSELVDAYKADTYWSEYADRIQAILNE